MFEDLTHQKKISFPCNKCGGLVIVEYDIDYRWEDKGMYLDKIYCLECKRVFTEYQYTIDDLSKAVIEFKWVEWRD